MAQPPNPTAASVVAVSRQRRWQIKQQAQGNCITCGKPRSHGFSKRCLKHQKAKRALDRKRAGYGKWHPGSAGRIPFEIKLRRDRAAQGKADGKT